MTNVLDFRDADIPADIPPAIDMPEGATSYDPEFPGSTPEAPYGYKPDGTPYKRRPNGGGGRPKSTGVKTGGKVNESTARAAASMLAQLNNLVGMSLVAFKMPLSGSAIMEANEQFERMAIEALKTDPKLCKKIMSMGSTSGRTALFMAYGYMGMSIYPAMREEYKVRRAELESAEDE